MSFWIFIFPHQLNNNRELRYCPLIHKGKDDKDKNEYHRSPLILLDRKTKQLKVVISTSDLIQTQGESMETNGRVMENKWVHIGVVRGDKSLSIYMNGQLDSMNNTIGWTVSNQDDLYLGSTPNKINECNFQFYLDEFRFYARELKDYEIQAE